MKRYVEILDKGGNVIRRGSNLRVVLEHARRVGLASVSLYPEADGGGLLVVNYADQGRSRVSFASHAVATQFVRSRRSWRNEGLQPVCDWGANALRMWSIL